MNERRVHRIFQVSILLKGAHSLLECAGGLALVFASRSSITNLVGALTQHELGEHPDDPVAGYLLRSAQELTVGTQHFYAAYLLAHGLIKVCLVAALLRNWLWAYPASLFVLGLFIVYQLYRFSWTHGIGLIVLSVFDLFVLALIWHEYRQVRRQAVSR